MKFPIYASAGVLLTLAGLSTASTASAASATGHGLTTVAGLPKFYVETGIAPHGASKPQDVVRATASGAITGTVLCPWPRSQVREVTAAATRVFFLDCVRSSGASIRTVTGTRIFRFQLTRGRATGYSLVPGGVFKGFAGGLAASANGAELAVNVTGGPDSGATIVISTKTGAHAIWRGGVMPGGAIFNGGQASLTANGKELAVYGRAHCPKSAAPGTCKSPGQEMRVMSPASAGGKLASGRMVFKESQLTKPSEGFINDAFINSGGTTATAGIVFGAGVTGSYVEVLSVSVATGRPLKVEFKLNTGNGFSYSFVSADPSGRWVLFNAGPSSHTINGWVNHGKLVPLKPAGGDTFGEAWSS